MSGELLINRAAEHVTLTLHRPESRNALSVGLRDAVSDALDELAEDPSVKAVVVTGAGSVFSAGFDLKEFSVPPATTPSWRSCGHRATASTAPC